MYLLKKEEDIEITEKSLFKTKGFALLFPNHVQLVTFDEKVIHVSQPLKLDRKPPRYPQRDRV